jgi:hypothetical protein
MEPHNNQPQMNANNRSNKFQLTSLQTMHKLGFLEFANGTSVITTRQQEYDETRKERRAKGLVISYKADGYFY